MDHTNGLLSLGGQKNLSFSGEGTVWTGAIALVEANASSAVAPASRGAVSEEKESTSCLKEHDYIGLTEVSSSVKPLPDVKAEDELSETDLDLGLGLGLGPVHTKKAEDCEKSPVFLLKQKDRPLKAQKESISKPAMEAARYSLPEGTAALQKPWQNAAPMRPMTAEAHNSPNLTAAREYENPSKVAIYVQDFGEGPSRVGGSTIYGGHLKNGTKRGYSEAMIEATRFSVMGGTRIGTAGAGMNGEGEVKALPKHQQGAYITNWVPSKPNVPAHWPVGLDQSSAHSFASNKSGVEKPVADRTPSNYNAPESSKEPASSEPPPPKGQVVGWPPIRSYRKQNLAKPSEMYVKVNMDGMTVGRKVDLNAHSSYEGLLLALEEMFQPSSNGGQGTSQLVSARDGHAHDVKQFRLLNGSDFVLTYEDQDGDWMLVGDVPWSMFVSTVRRLRITRGAEATGLAPRRPDKIK